MPPGHGFARRVTLESLPTFAPLLRRPGQPAADEGTSDEPPADDGAGSGGVEPPADPGLELALGHFQGQSVRIQNPHQRAPRTPRPATVGQGAVTAPQAPAPEAPAPQLPAPVEVPPGAVVWRKRPLPASDVQRQEGNPTGGLRLTQARFTTAAGQRIDQTTYFRRDLFGHLPWRGIRNNPFVEATNVPMRVVLLGRDFGERKIEVSHKPTGEAGQHNYTTILHWGELAADVRALNLVGRTLELLAPPPGSDGPFTLRVQ